jgi:peptidyl-prolyl cis-trans isomerase SDCCAG10
VQTGDKTGTGAGGESFFGGASFVSPWKTFNAHVDITESFEDEIHPRLRFSHRGLVAAANTGTKNSNDSQFFITLGSSLHNEPLELS